MQTRPYDRKRFTVDAVQVTAENMSEIAEWCDGVIEVETHGDLAKFIRVKVRHPLNARQTKAFVGDWVLKAGESFKVYNQQAFANSFIPTDESVTETVEETLKRLHLRNQGPELVGIVNTMQTRTVEIDEPAGSLVHQDQGRFEI